VVFDARIQCHTVAETGIESALAQMVDSAFVVFLPC